VSSRLKWFAAVCSIWFAFIFTLTGCGSGNDSAPGDLDAFVKLFTGYAADYEPARSPQQLAEWSDLVVLGRIHSVTDGRIHGDGVSRSTTVVVAVDVREVKKGALPPRSENRVYVEMESSYQRPASAYDKVAPRDVDALLFLTPAPATGVPGGQRIENPDAGRPNGQPLWQVTTPQGFLVGSATQGVFQVREFENYPSASLEEFFPEADRFPPDPSRTPET